MKACTPRCKASIICAAAQPPLTCNAPPVASSTALYLGPGSATSIFRPAHGRQVPVQQQDVGQRQAGATEFEVLQHQHGRADIGQLLHLTEQTLAMQTGRRLAQHGRGSQFARHGGQVPAGPSAAHCCSR